MMKGAKLCVYLVNFPTEYKTLLPQDTEKES